MTVLPVRTIPDPVLRTAASPVPAGADVRALVADMIETMHACLLYTSPIPRDRG